MAHPIGHKVLLVYFSKTPEVDIYPISKGILVFFIQKRCSVPSAKTKTYLHSLLKNYETLILILFLQEGRQFRFLLEAPEKLNRKSSVLWFAKSFSLFMD